MHNLVVAVGKSSPYENCYSHYFSCSRQCVDVELIKAPEAQSKQTSTEILHVESQGILEAVNRSASHE